MLVLPPTPCSTCRYYIYSAHYYILYIVIFVRFLFPLLRMTLSWGGCEWGKYGFMLHVTDDGKKIWGKNLWIITCVMLWTHIKTFEQEIERHFKSIELYLRLPLRAIFFSSFSFFFSLAISTYPSNGITYIYIFMYIFAAHPMCIYISKYNIWAQMRVYFQSFYVSNFCEIWKGMVLI